MFKCQKCRVQTKANEKSHRIVTETRVREYTYFKDKKRHTSEGWEISKENSVCTGCFEETLTR